MALFETKNVTLALERMVIHEHSDRYWSSVEPYVIPVFFKIDGERYEAVLSFFDTPPPREGTTEVTETTEIHFAVNSIPTEDNPFLFTPAGNITGRGSFDSGDEVDLSDISFTTDLQPIPFRINLFGLANLGDILESLREIVILDEGISALNTTLAGINAALSDLFGLNERIETCPSDSIDSDEFLNYIEAQFNCLIPGTIGGAFAVMEQDNFTESEVQTIQDTIREEIGKVINDTVNSITRVNPIPDTSADDADQDEITSQIIGALLPSLGLKLGLSIGAVILASVVNIFLGMALLVAGLFYWIGGPDDNIGFDLQTFDHTSLEDTDFQTMITGDDNEWELFGFLRINS
jgi:hypothetical protein